MSTHEHARAYRIPTVEPDKDANRGGERSVTPSQSPTALALGLTPPAHRPSTQRKCACGGTTVAGGECAACRAKRLRSEVGTPNPASLSKGVAKGSGDFAFSGTPVHPRRGKGPLEVSEPSDPAEREARGIAEQLFPSSPPPERASYWRAASIDASMPARPAQRESKEDAAPCTNCGGTGKLPVGAADKGSPLPAPARNEMEGAFGADFSSVRIHTNSGAAQLSRSLKAQAFTYGDDIFFDQGKYDPESVSGKQLLAHELAHTIQQRETIATLARQGSGRTTLQCVNENLSSAGVASWLIAIVGGACGLLFGIAGSPTGPGAAGTAAFGAAVCIAGVIGFSVGAVLGVISGCWSDPNFRSRGAYLSSAGGAGAGSTTGTGEPGSATA